LTEAPKISIIIPAFQEGRGIIPVLERLINSVASSFECLVVIDDLDDETVEVVNSFNQIDSRIRFVHNDLGPGPAQAIRAGFKNAKSKITVITMADGSDDPKLIDSLAQLVERGVVIAAGSRYMSGGQQVGSTGLKPIFSRIAGLTLKWFARVGTHDATNSFKAYSVTFVESVGIESKYGFEIGIEMVAKARRLRLPVAELPTIWLERFSGESNFNLKSWFPHYFVWYIFAFGKNSDVPSLQSSSMNFQKFKNRFFSKE
jgi:dolichol-phosphate mannosyltransferase